jgi:hypothetical protein
VVALLCHLLLLLHAAALPLSLRTANHHKHGSSAQSDQEAYGADAKELCSAAIARSIVHSVKLWLCNDHN